VALSKTLNELASQVGGEVAGDGDVVIHGVAPIDEAVEGEITFLNHPQYRRFLRECRAGAVIVGPEAFDEPQGRRLNLLRCSDPYIAFAKISQLFCPAPRFNGQISPGAYVDESAIVNEGVTIFPYAWIGARAQLGPGSVVFPGVFIGENAVIGAECVLHPNVVVREGFASLNEAKEKEEDLLDMAWGLEATSRLSCQAILDDENVVVEIPKYTINHARENH